MNIEVIDWIYYGSGKEKAPIGGLGGWFNSNLLHDKDYLDAHELEAHPYLEALKSKILENHLDTTGQEHQKGNIPLFSDDTVGEFSYRAWGDLMAAIYSTKESPLSYMEYYM